MKRKRGSADGSSRQKARSDVRPAGLSAAATPAGVEHPVLRRLYPQVATLRHHLVSQLPVSSKSRRRRISQLGHSTPAQGETAADVDHELGLLLDAALVGSSPHVKAVNETYTANERRLEIESFTQQRSQSGTGGTFRPGYLLQSETVDFVIWLLFKRTTVHKPAHLLCHGFQRAGAAHCAAAADLDPTSSIPGLLARSSNCNVRTLKEPAWCRLHALLGEGGDRLIMDLLLECAIFVPIKSHGEGTSLGNYYQLSGVPASDVKPGQGSAVKTDNGEVKAAASLILPKRSTEIKLPSTVTFVRSRMLYAKAALNAKGGVRFGMRHIHVLNRFPNKDDLEETVHILRYIFPRQYGLHNVFTSTVDSRETAMPFKDYTLREQEIHHSMCRALHERATNAEEVRKWKMRIPKRLRGVAVALVQKLRSLNQRCSYFELLRHYCPVEAMPLSSNPEWRRIPLERPVEDICFTDMACPTAHVSAFCRAVTAKVIPLGFWGNESNHRVLMYWIDQFVSLRRFETLTLHQVMQKLQVVDVAWLQPPGRDQATKLAKPDFQKRKELFQESVYWFFDSFLVPLIRSNFHVTETNMHRNRLFYFRHDVWRMLTETSLTTMKLSMFEEMPTERITKLLSMRSLGFSKIRLLPKKLGFRTITNLKRRQQIVRNGAMSLGRSINSAMMPVFNAINHEKSLQPDRFGCSLFSVTDMLPKLAAFKEKLMDQRLDEKQLYFAKVDVQSCFDTIPQSRLLTMISSLMSLPAYQTGKHVEISALGTLQRLDGQRVDPLPVKRYVAHSGGTRDMESFTQVVQSSFVGAKTNTIFVNTNMQQNETKDDLMRLLREHVERNLVKIGKRYYRQKKGIPQGSILSSILCNYFYAELERDVLSFALGNDCLLLRLLDDFLLITVDRSQAERFVHVMHRGHAEYGVVVKPAKSMTNFEVVLDGGTVISRSPVDTTFPYCGVHIDTRTLEIRKTYERTADSSIQDSLTVDLSRMAGQTFHRKALNGFKIQLKAMFIDTSLNSVATVLANLYQSFYEAAVRCIEYVRVLSKVRTTCSSLLIKTVDNIIALAFVMLQRRSRSRNDRQQAAAQRVISRRQLQWLACKAFQTVFQRQQTKHCALLLWLGKSLQAVRISDAAERNILEDAAATGAR